MGTQATCVFKNPGFSFKFPGKGEKTWGYGPFSTENQPFMWLNIPYPLGLIFSAKRVANLGLKNAFYQLPTGP